MSQISIFPDPAKLKNKMFVLGAGFWALGSLGASLLNILDKKTKPLWLFSRGAWGSNHRYSGGPRSRLSQWTLVVNAAASYTLFSCYASKPWALHSLTFGCWSLKVVVLNDSRKQSACHDHRGTQIVNIPNLGNQHFQPFLISVPMKQPGSKCQRRPKLSSVNMENERSECIAKLWWRWPKIRVQPVLVVVVLVLSLFGGDLQDTMTKIPWTTWLFREGG